MYKLTRCTDALTPKCCLIYYLGINFHHHCHLYPCVLPQRILMLLQSRPPEEDFFQAFLDRKIATQIAHRQTRNSLHPWEDAYQAACAKLWESTRQGKFRQGNLEDYCHWAARVCYYAIKDHLAHSANRQHDSLNQPIPNTDLTLQDTLTDDFDSLEVLERTERLQTILRLIQDLDRHHPRPIHQAIWQALLLDKKQKDIAQDLGVTTSDICRYWRKIREEVAKQYPGDHENSAIDRRRTNDPW